MTIIHGEVAEGDADGRIEPLWPCALVSDGVKVFPFRPFVLMRARTVFFGIKHTANNQGISLMSRIS